MAEKKKKEEIVDTDPAERFIWKEGDLEYVGHQPLTDEQKELVKRIKEEEEEE